MKDTIEVGIELEQEFTVLEEWSPPHLPVKVLSTPWMINLIEVVCRDAVQSHLDDNETTVGTHVNVSHDAPAMAGEMVKVRAKLTEVNKRRLTFETHVEGDKGTLSTGTHQRAVVDTSRMGG